MLYGSILILIHCREVAVGAGPLVFQLFDFHSYLVIYPISYCLSLDDDNSQAQIQKGITACAPCCLCPTLPLLVDFCL